MSASLHFSMPRLVLSSATVHRLLFAFVCLVWGTNWLAMKTGIAVVPPGVFSGLRWTVAGLVLLAWRWSRGFPPRLNPRQAGRVLLVSVLLVAVNAPILLYSLKYVGSGLASVVNSALTPISLLGFAVALGQERFNAWQAGAIALGIAGILVLFGPAAMAGTLDTMTLLGTAGVIASCVIYSLGSVLSIPLMRTLPPTELAGMTNFIGGGTLLVLSLIFEPGAWHAMRFDWGVAVWASWLFLVLLGSLGATVIYFLLVRDWGASRTGTYAFVSPVVAVLLGVAVLGEQVHLNDAIGMALMLVAAGLVLRRTS
jgi:drug/metabolite transporter (DMT)-like permease